MFYVSLLLLFFFKQRPAYGMRISDWSSDVCSSDLYGGDQAFDHQAGPGGIAQVDEPRLRPVRIGLPQRARLFQFGDEGATGMDQIGRASCRERVCKYV